MEYEYEVRLLSLNFEQQYPSLLFPELMLKHGRPYTCLLLESKDGYLICIPFRSDIKHKNAYLFHNSTRSKKSPSGLDYSKMVLLKDGTFLDSLPAVVDQDEYNEMVQNLDTITADVTTYIDEYVDHQKGLTLLHPREFARKYQFSTLPYFHDILGLPNQ